MQCYEQPVDENRERQGPCHVGDRDHTSGPVRPIAAESRGAWENLAGKRCTNQPVVVRRYSNGACALTEDSRNNADRVHRATRSRKRGARRPVQLWSAADDRHQPHPFYDEPLREEPPGAPEYHAVGNAGHQEFLPPCDARLSRIRPEICSSLPGLNRAAFHEQFDAAIVRFFQATLR